MPLYLECMCDVESLEVHGLHVVDLEGQDLPVVAIVVGDAVVSVVQDVVNGIHRDVVHGDDAAVPEDKKYA